MKNLLKFFLEVEKLKQMPRTGWVLREVKNPETVAEHILGWQSFLGCRLKKEISMSKGRF